MRSIGLLWRRFSSSIVALLLSVHCHGKTRLHSETLNSLYAELKSASPVSG